MIAHAHTHARTQLQSVVVTQSLTRSLADSHRDDCPPYHSDPEALVYQAKTAALTNKIKFCGENALPCTDDWEALDQILKKVAPVTQVAALPCAVAVSSWLLPEKIAARPASLIFLLASAFLPSSLVVSFSDCPPRYVGQAKYLDSFCFLRWSEALVQGDSLFRKFAHYLSKVPRPDVIG